MCAVDDGRGQPVDSIDDDDDDDDGSEDDNAADADVVGGRMQYSDSAATSRSRDTTSRSHDPVARRERPRPTYVDYVDDDVSDDDVEMTSDGEEVVMVARPDSRVGRDGYSERPVTGSTRRRRDDSVAQPQVTTA